MTYEELEKKLEILEGVRRTTSADAADAHQRLNKCKAKLSESLKEKSELSAELDKTKSELIKLKESCVQLHHAASRAFEYEKCNPFIRKETFELLLSLRSDKECIELADKQKDEVKSLKKQLDQLKKERERLKNDLDGAIDVMKDHDIPLPEHFKTLGKLMGLEIENSSLSKENQALKEEVFLLKTKIENHELVESPMQNEIWECCQSKIASHLIDQLWEEIAEIKDKYKKRENSK